MSGDDDGGTDNGDNHSDSDSDSESYDAADGGTEESCRTLRRLLPKLRSTYTQPNTRTTRFKWPG